MTAGLHEHVPHVRKLWDLGFCGQIAAQSVGGDLAGNLRASREHALEEAFRGRLVAALLHKASDRAGSSCVESCRIQAPIGSRCCDVETHARGSQHFVQRIEAWVARIAQGTEERLFAHSCAACYVRHSLCTRHIAQRCSQSCHIAVCKHRLHIGRPRIGGLKKFPHDLIQATASRFLTR